MNYNLIMQFSISGRRNLIEWGGGNDLLERLALCGNYKTDNIIQFLNSININNNTGTDLYLVTVNLEIEKPVT